MHVVQYAFEGGRTNPHRLENHEVNGVVYTGTHDNDTAAGWWRSLNRAQQRATGLDTTEPNWSLIERAFSSRANLAIVPLQDVLGLGCEARMNTPGTMKGNWSWRLEPGQLTDKLAERLRGATEVAGRA
jgi:4-alpha-glucanotransferase